MSSHRGPCDGVEKDRLLMTRTRGEFIRLTPEPWRRVYGPNTRFDAVSGGSGTSGMS